MRALQILSELYDIKLYIFLNQTHLQNNGLTKFSGWTSWGPWSPCSRSCDGGVSTQTRKCLYKAGCNGPDKNYRICNMQVCYNIKFTCFLHLVTMDYTGFRALIIIAYLSAAKSRERRFNQSTDKMVAEFR